VLRQKPLKVFANCAKGGLKRTERRLAMSSSDQNKQRNREIAENEANRQVVGDVRVSVWAIAVTVVVGLIVFGIVWAWLNR
jgi:Flp pilus assembly protein TadB